MLTTLIAVGGFAVDIGNWYLNISRMQRAADAAALAGAVYLPGDANTAIATASDVAKKNAFAESQVESNVQPLHPSQLKVTVSGDVKNAFIQLIGLKANHFSRSAVGEYHPYVPMGSPSNVLGVEPKVGGLSTWEKASVAGTQGHYWLNISSAGNQKSTGDRFSSGRCENAADQCDKYKSPPRGNADYASNGQQYIVRIESGASGILAVEAFDPGFSFVGDNCDNGDFRSGAEFPGNSDTYAWGSKNPACTGDQMENSSRVPPTTTFALYTPEQTPGGSQQVVYGTCRPKLGQGIYEGVKSGIRNRIASDPSFRAQFRNWSRVCTLPITVGGAYPPGDYVLRVFTSNDMGWDGLNRFALRAGFVTTANVLDVEKSRSISLFSKGRLVIYAKDEAADSTFYLARITPGARGQTMVVSLFDIGDAAAGADLQFIPPVDAQSGGTTMTRFPTCKYTRPGQPGYQDMEAGCRILDMRSGTYNGKLVNLKVTFPPDYSCNEEDPEGCWTRLKLHYKDGGVQDTTSWMASLNANPVRLVPDQG